MHANLAMDESLDYLLAQPLPGMRMLPHHGPTSIWQGCVNASDAKAVAVAAAGAEPECVVALPPGGRVVRLMHNWSATLDSIVASIKANQPKIVGVQVMLSC